MGKWMDFVWHVKLFVLLRCEKCLINRIPASFVFYVGMNLFLFYLQPFVIYYLITTKHDFILFYVFIAQLHACWFFQRCEVFRQVWICFCLFFCFLGFRRVDWTIFLWSHIFLDDKSFSGINHEIMTQIRLVLACKVIFNFFLHFISHISSNHNVFFGKVLLKSFYVFN